MNSQSQNNSSIEGISLNHLKDVLGKLVKKINEFIKKELEEASFLCINRDLWSSIKYDEFLGISCSWINQNWKKVTRIIGVINVNEVYINSTILEKYFQKLFVDLNIEKKRKCFASDQGGNIKKCIIDCLKEEYYRCGCHWIPENS